MPMMSGGWRGWRAMWRGSVTDASITEPPLHLRRLEYFEVISSSFIGFIDSVTRPRFCLAISAI